MCVDGGERAGVTRVDGGKLMVQSALWRDEITADAATVGKTADVATTGLLILRQGNVTYFLSEKSHWLCKDEPC